MATAQRLIRLLEDIYQIRLVSFILLHKTEWFQRISLRMFSSNYSGTLKNFVLNLLSLPISIVSTLIQQIAGLPETSGRVFCLLKRLLIRDIEIRIWKMNGIGKELWSEISKLPKKQRSVVMMRIAEELSYKEISKIIGMAEGSAKVNFHHALKTLKQRLNHD